MSQIITDIDRGNPVTITVIFQDSTGNTVYPANAEVTFAYYVERECTSNTISMSNTVTGWTATWDSSPTDEGIVDYCVISSGPRIVMDGSFRVERNRANAR
jgi:hypothetical protein